MELFTLFFLVNRFLNYLGFMPLDKAIFNQILDDIEVNHILAIKTLRTHCHNITKQYLDNTEQGNTMSDWAFIEGYTYIEIPETISLKAARDIVAYIRTNKVKD